MSLPEAGGTTMYLKNDANLTFSFPSFFYYPCWYPPKGVWYPSKGVCYPSKEVRYPSRGVWYPPKGMISLKMGVISLQRGVISSKRVWYFLKGFDIPSEGLISLQRDWYPSKWFDIPPKGCDIHPKGFRILSKGFHIPPKRHWFPPKRVCLIKEVGKNYRKIEKEDNKPLRTLRVSILLTAVFTNQSSRWDAQFPKNIS